MKPILLILSLVAMLFVASDSYAQCSGGTCAAGPRVSAGYVPFQPVRNIIRARRAAVYQADASGSRFVAGQPVRNLFRARPLRRLIQRKPIRRGLRRLFCR